MMMVGWEYASSAGMGGNDDGSSNAIGMGGGQQRHQRHANFQYGNRRMLVEEALRTMSAVLPPRNPHGGGNTVAVAGGNAALNNVPGLNSRMNNERGSSAGTRLALDDNATRRRSGEEGASILSR